MWKFKGSKVLMKAVFANLIKNALKYGGRDVDIAVVIDKNKVMFRGNGYGIPEEKLDKIFDKFYTTSGSGAGIGLTFCQKFMESIDGSITCHSQLGEYTEFVLDFGGKM